MADILADTALAFVSKCLQWQDAELTEGAAIRNLGMLGPHYDGPVWRHDFDFPSLNYLDLPDVLHAVTLWCKLHRLAVELRYDGRDGAHTYSARVFIPSDEPQVVIESEPSDIETLPLLSACVAASQHVTPRPFGPQPE